ncbi:hypothetical protein VP01_89g11 [Puccinia sorghi]|uniref:UBC core domain-containing protein n=1 Tax=Puccinia sorghi TaxID=27349 RepID=A0A0L6U7T3_9BASI|nr:hypothetical protein VP01_89g11 [Puccinia sorghi]
MASNPSAVLLRKQLAEFRKRPVEGFSAGLVDDNDVYEWDITIFGPAHGELIETCLLWRFSDGAFLRARMSFPAEFPLLPPKLRFTTQMWHPNSNDSLPLNKSFLAEGLTADFFLVYPDGTVCISILHPPGNDEYGYEDAGERWLPVHTIESILVSVTSLLASENPNTESPANIDAAKELRDDPASYKKRVRRLARKSADDCFD